MSITESEPEAQPQPEPEPEPEPADRIFERYVWNRPGVCNGCFCLIKNDHRKIAWGEAGHDKEDLDDHGEQTVRNDKGAVIGTEPVGTYGERARYPSRTVCTNCGAIAGRADDETLSRREALARAETLAERLAEIGEPVELSLLKGRIGHLKSQERYECYDTVVFEAATTVAIRHARSQT